jgi:hypothetical protein
MIMADVEIPVGSRDGRGAGDHDQPYNFGNPKACLTTRELIHLIVLRGFVIDVRGGATGLAADGDIVISDRFVRA